jgi:diguanylate cyclase (GGDEF)-like protein
MFIRCVAAGGELATAFLAEDRRGAMESFCTHVAELLGARSDQVSRVLDRVMALTADVGPLFDTTLLSAEDAVALLEEAQELLAVRNVESLHEIHELQRTTQSLADRSVRLEDATRRDALTGVFNRGYLDARLQAEFEAARSGGWPLGALFIDLDHFKKVNDTHGHAAGDDVLRTAARILREAVREQDLLARYGGEEFVVLLPGIAPADASGFAERILAGLRAHEHRCGEHRFHVTASLGFAVDTTATPFASPSALIAAADAAVYAAKRAGRNRMVVHGDRGTAQAVRAG